MIASAQALKAGIRTLEGVGHKVTELIRHQNLGVPTKVDHGGVAIDLMKTGLLVRDLGPTQVHVGKLLMDDANAMFKPGVPLHRMTDHVLEGIKALSGRLQHTPD